MKRFFLGIIGIIMISVFVSCGKFSSSTKEGSASGKTPETTVSTPAAETHDGETESGSAPADLQQLLWTEEELGEVGSIIYPGFELGSEEDNGARFRKWTSASGIEVLEKVEGDDDFPVSRGNIIVCSADAKKEYSLRMGIGNLNNKNSFSKEDKKIFLRDMTGDGQEELVIFLPCNDMEINEKYLYVFDVKTLEQIAMPADLRDRLKEGLDVEIKGTDGSMLTVEIVIGEKAYQGSCEINPEWSAGDMEWELRMDYGGYYAEDAKIYYRAGIYVYHKDYPHATTNGTIIIDIPMEYNSEAGAFEAAEGEYIVK